MQTFLHSFFFFFFPVTMSASVAGSLKNKKLLWRGEKMIGRIVSYFMGNHSSKGGSLHFPTHIFFVGVAVLLVAVLEAVGECCSLGDFLF